MAVTWDTTPDKPGPEDPMMTRREVAYLFKVTSATVVNWSKRKPPALTEVRDALGRPRYHRAEVQRLYDSGFRGERRRDGS